MILVITGIGSLIHIYSTAYMHDETDSEFARYFSYLNLFAAFMLVLVLGSSFPVMFVGWEGVGLCSYLLIGFWFQKKSAADAGKKAFIVNRIGDFGFLLGMFLLFSAFGTLDFQQRRRARCRRLAPETTFGARRHDRTLLLFVGATGKSAQIPLYVWLPDAMEGPTPVSALIHAATMVTAGVYMIGRNAVLFSHAPVTLAVVAVIGAATALMAGTIGLVQNDIKRVLAYSTVSQLGYMFLAMGVGAFAAGIFHLYTHAFFKALLFLGSGAVIHALRGRAGPAQHGRAEEGAADHLLDVPDRRAGDRRRAAAGRVLQQGRDPLADVRAAGTPLLWAVGMVTSFLTATTCSGWSSWRSTASVGHRQHQDGRSRRSSGRARTRTQPAATGSHGTATAHLHDAPPAMALALVVLAIGSVVAGYVGVPHALGGIEPDRGVPRAELHGATRARRARPASRGGRAARRRSRSRRRPRRAGHRADADGALELVAFAGIGIAAFFFLRNRRGGRRDGARFAGLHTLLAQQVLRRRALRRGDRPADQADSRPRRCGAGSMPASSTARSTASARSSRQERRAAAAADRVGARLRGVAVPRRRRDRRATTCGADRRPCRCC